VIDYPPDPDTFYPLVWKIVAQIPSGVVSTYGQIASMIPPPAGVDPTDYEHIGPRWVGKAMNAVSSRDDPAVPWQRVINSQGGISLPEGSKAAIEQRIRLEREGLTFDQRGRVDIKTAGWDGPDEDWLRENGLFPPRPLKKPPADKPKQPTLF
jgi:methylated-DNA-protein-cysteine methyltransferase related protein